MAVIGLNPGRLSTRRGYNPSIRLLLEIPRGINFPVKAQKLWAEREWMTNVVEGNDRRWQASRRDEEF